MRFTGESLSWHK